MGIYSFLKHPGSIPAYTFGVNAYDLTIPVIVFIFSCVSELSGSTAYSPQLYAEVSSKLDELERSNCELRLQLEELQFAYEKECERRQHHEEMRYKAEDLCRYVGV